LTTIKRHYKIILLTKKKMMKTDNTNLIADLKEYFLRRPSVEMAFVFGSRVKGKMTIESDLDIAVYLKPKTGKLDCEDEVFFEEENEIWNDIEKISKCNIDFIVLNRAPSLLAWSILKNGKPIIIKNRFRYLDFLLRTTSNAIDFRNFISDFRAIKMRSQSLNLEDKDRLIKLTDFLETELSDYDKYKNFDFKTYESDREKRRSLERWIENIINASIDIAKVILASQKKQFPETYIDILKTLASLSSFEESIANKMASFVKLRNIIAHEYLDLRFTQIQEFLKEAKKIYAYLINYADVFIKDN
jgi:uncharacterized protein YutE (UPF0331/DUF86 family)/predicted nucleotidyltransferase